MFNLFGATWYYITALLYISAFPFLFQGQVAILTVIDDLSLGVRSQALTSPVRTNTTCSDHLPPFYFIRFSGAGGSGRKAVCSLVGTKRGY